MAQIEFDFRKVHSIYNKNTTFTGKCTNFMLTNAKKDIWRWQRNRQKASMASAAQKQQNTNNLPSIKKRSDSREPLQLLYPRAESNRNRQNRNLKFYPLNYGGFKNFGCEFSHFLRISPH